MIEIRVFTVRTEQLTMWTVLLSSSDDSPTIGTKYSNN